MSIFVGMDMVFLCQSNETRAPSQYKPVFPRYRDSHVKDKTVARPATVLSLTWGILIRVRRHLYIETAPRVLLQYTTSLESTLNSNIAFVRNIRFSRPIVLKFCTKHHSITAVLFANSKTIG